MTWEWILWVTGGLSIAVALWFTVGPWTVHLGGETINCGSPFMGRYRSPADPAASNAMVCHLQAANRLHIAEVAWIVGIGLVLLGLALWIRGRPQPEGRVHRGM
jgi:hypothetical protein